MIEVGDSLLLQIHGRVLVELEDTMGGAHCEADRRGSMVQ